jgi:beta-D-xylosidase 4
MGTGIKSMNNFGFAAALSAAQESDFIFYLGGIDNSIEAEELD